MKLLNIHDLVFIAVVALVTLWLSRPMFALVNGGNSASNPNS